MGDKERSESGKIKEIHSLEELQSREGRAVWYSYDGGISWIYGVIPIELGLRRQGREIVQEEVIQDEYNPKTNIEESGINVYEESDIKDPFVDSGRRIHVFESDFSNPDFRIRTTTDEEINDRNFPFGTVSLKEDEPLIKPSISEQIKRTEEMTLTFLPDREEISTGGRKTVIFNRDIISE